jgi:hypothetical protein
LSEFRFDVLKVKIVPTGNASAAEELVDRFAAVPLTESTTYVLGTLVAAVPPDDR